MADETKSEIKQVAMELRDAAAAMNGFQRFVYNGTCMNPILMKGDYLLVQDARPEELLFGDIVVYRKQDQFVAHRFLCCRPGEDNALQIITKSDDRFEEDNPFHSDFLIGKVVEINKNGKKIKLYGGFKRIESYLIAAVSVAEAIIFEAMIEVKRKLFKNVKIKKTFRSKIEKMISMPKLLLLKWFILA